MRGARGCGQPGACSLHARCATNLCVYRSHLSRTSERLQPKMWANEKKKKKKINGGENKRGGVQGRLHKHECHHRIHSRCQKLSWMGTSAWTQGQAAPLLACLGVSITLAKPTWRKSSSSLIAVSSLSYLGSLLWPTPPTVHDHLKRTAPVLRAPVSFHPVTLCRANHSLNVLTVKLLLSLLFSTKFSHNNPPVIFFTNKIYE